MSTSILRGNILGPKYTAPSMGRPQLLIEVFKRRFEHQVSLEQVQSNIHFLKKKLALNPARVQKNVSIDPRTMHGNPVFAGTRIPVYQIVEELAEGTTVDELVGGYPSLSAEQIRNGLDFVASLLRIYDD